MRVFIRAMIRPFDIVALLGSAWFIGYMTWVGTNPALHDIGYLAFLHLAVAFLPNAIIFAWVFWPRKRRR